MKDLSTMSLKELKDYCRNNGIKGYSNKTVEGILELIKNSDLKNSDLKNSGLKNSGLKNSGLKFIDLFCGIGGFHQAMGSLGGECVLASDIDKKCGEVYKLNYGITPVKDVKDIDEKTMDDFDIICGGFPCQSFSNGGKKKAFGDKRGLLFDEIMRIAKENKPKFMFLENVKHILKVSDGEVFEYIKKRIKEIGYVLQIFQMSPHNYGIPQQRERIFFVCVRNDIYNGEDIELYSKNLRLTAADIVDKECDEKYDISDGVKQVLDAWDVLIKQFEVGEKLSPTLLLHDHYKNYSVTEFAALPSWKQDYMNKNKPLIQKYKKIIDPWYKKYKDVLSKRDIYGQLEWQTGVLKENESIYNHFIQLRQSGIRVKKGQYFPTLVAISQIPIYGKYKRHITPRECARLQSFPESFKLDESDRVVYKQMGNSVNVYNVFTVINSTFKHYGLSYKKL